MSDQIVTQNADAMQVRSQDGKDLIQRCLTRCLSELWSNYAHYQNGSMCFYFSELSEEDKRLLLFNAIPIEEYEWLAETPSRLRAGIEEERGYMSKLIDEYCDEMWHEVMNEAHEYRRGHRNDESC